MQITKVPMISTTSNLNEPVKVGWGSSAFAFVNLIVAQIDITLFQLPLALWYDGTFTAVILLAVICIQAVITSRLLIEATRLQSNTLNSRFLVKSVQLRC